MHFDYPISLLLLEHVYVFSFLTIQPAIKVRVGGHLEARMWQQEAADVGEAGVNMLPHIL